MSPQSAAAPPKLVLIIRHGEKPGAPDQDGDVPSPNLSIRGSARAAALPSLFTPDPSGSGAPAQQLSCTLAAAKSKSARFKATYNAPAGTQAPAPRFPTPQHIVATQTSKHSNRPIETVTPTSEALGHKIHDKYSDDEYAEAAQHVLKKYGGDVVLVCWHHGKIPELAGPKGFGVPQAQITAALGGAKKWPGDVFDWIWSIDWSGGSANLTPGYQQLLYGDQSAG